MIEAELEIQTIHKEVKIMEVIIDGVPYVPMPQRAAGLGLDSALEIRFSSDAGDNITVREYFLRLLQTLWEKGDGFSGKRPFGNSGWDYDLYAPLMREGFIAGKLDDEGFVEAFGNEAEAHEYVRNLMAAAICGVPAP